MDLGSIRSAYQGPRQYFIEFYLRGIVDAYSYPVTPEMHDRLRSVLPDIQLDETFPRFWGFETIDGRCVTISIHDIQLARLLWEPGVSNDVTEDDDEYDDKISLYLRGRSEPFCCSTSSARQAFELLIDIDTAQEADSRFLSFVDENEEDVFFNVTDLLIFEAPKKFIDDGESEGNED